MIVAVLIIVGSMVGVYYYSTLPIPSASPPPSPTSTPTFSSSPSPTPTPLFHLYLIRAWLWENGRCDFILGAGAIEDRALLRYLFQILHGLNLQAECSLGEERIEAVKENDKLIELNFRFPWPNLTISQWVRPEDRDSVKTDEGGYKVFEKIHDILLILEDNLNMGLGAHVLIESEPEGWSCWVTQKDGEIDKSWIEEANRYLLTPVSRYLTYRNGTETKVYLVESHLSYGVFDEDVTIPLKGRSAKKGDPAVIIEGTVRNDYDRYYYFAITGDLYNSKGEKFEGTNYIFDLPIGEFAVTPLVSAHSFGTFKLHFRYEGQDIEHYDLYLYMEPLNKPPP